MESLSIGLITDHLGKLHASISVSETVDLCSLRDVFKEVSHFCFSSFVNQATLADSDAAPLITSLLSYIISNQSDDKLLSELSLEAINCGYVALISLLAGQNQRSLHKCHQAGTCKTVLEGLKIILLNQKSQQCLLPSINNSPRNSKEMNASKQNLLSASENALVLLENLTLYGPLQEEVKQRSGCELIVQLLVVVASQLPAIAEHGVTVLSNLCCSATTTTVTADTAASSSMNNILATASELTEADTGESIIQRIVRAGCCEVALNVLSQYAADVCVSDATLYLIQSLAARDDQALQKFENYYKAPSKKLQSKIRANLRGTTSLYSLTKQAVNSTASPSKSFTFGSLHNRAHGDEPPADRESHGVIALLLRVLRIHCANSITIAEAVVAALGSLVLQSPLLLLHLLAISGVEALLQVLEHWGAANAGVSAKCFRILVEMVELTRRGRAELARVNNYFDSPIKNQVGVSPATVSSPAGSVVVHKSTAQAHIHAHVQQRQQLSTCAPPQQQHQRGTGKSATDSESPEEGASLFDCDDEAEANLTIDIGIPGITSAQLFKLLDKVNICLLLMSAENGTLEKEMSKHGGAVAKKRAAMASVANIAHFAAKIKSFKGNKNISDKTEKTPDKEDMPKGEGVATSKSLASLILPKIVASASTSNTNTAAAASTATTTTSTATTSNVTGTALVACSTLSKGDSSSAFNSAAAPAAPAVTPTPAAAVSLLNLVALNKALSTSAKISKQVPIADTADGTTDSTTDKAAENEPGVLETTDSADNFDISTEDHDKTFEPVYVWVVRLLDCHRRSLEVLHPALRLLLVMCDFKKYPHHWGQVAATGQGTGCAVLVKAFRNPELRGDDANYYEHNNSSAAGQDINIVYTSEMVVQTLHLLALSSAGNREKLSHTGAHSIVVDLLHAHGVASLVLSTTGAAVFVLLYDNISSKEANEGNAVACKSVLHLLQHYLDNVRFAEIGFHMLQVLAAYTPNQRFLSQQKGCVTIVALLRHYTLQPGDDNQHNGTGGSGRRNSSGRNSARNLAIAMQGLATLAHLAGLDDNESRIAKSGGCKLVVELTREYGFSYEAAAAEGLSAISVLAKHNRGMLGEVGACSIITDLLLHYNPSPEALNENIAHLAAMACFNLCLEYAENKKRFLQLNIANKFKDILHHRELSHASRGVVKDAINVVRF